MKSVSYVRHLFVLLWGYSLLSHVAKAQEKTVSLSDIENSPYASEIQNAVGYGLFSGKDGNRFDPQGAFSREQAAAVAQNLLGVFSIAPSPDGPPHVEDLFEDVGAQRWSAGAIAHLAELGLMKGYDQGPGRKNVFRPEQTATRAELVALFRSVVEAARQEAGLEPSSPLFQEVQTPFPFSDVPLSHWARPAVAALAGYCQAAHVADKKPGTVFGPGVSATRAFAAAVAGRVFACVHREILGKEPPLVQIVKLVAPTPVDPTPPVTPPPPPPPQPKVLTDDDWSVEVAKIGVGYRYWWGGGPLTRGQASKGYCRGNCPNCSGAGPFGADCSGYVSKVWRLPEAMPLDSMKHPFTANSFTRAGARWFMVPRSALRRGHVAATRVHVVFVADTTGDNWGKPFVYEAKGCSWGIVGNYKNLSTYVFSQKRQATGPGW